MDGMSRTRFISTRRKVFVLLVLGSVFLLGIRMTEKEPQGLGIRAGRLAECPASPNCVSTQTESRPHRMLAISFEGEPGEAKKRIQRVIQDYFSRARLVEEGERYLRYEFSSFIFRFVDDVEFLIDDKMNRIEFRSASRVGYSDLGVNRRRMEKFRREMTP